MGLQGRLRNRRWLGRGLGAGMRLRPRTASCVFSLSAAGVLVLKLPVLGVPGVWNLQVYACHQV